MFITLIGQSAQAHYAPQDRKHQVIHALNLTWCGKANKTCKESREAYQVAYCETGGTFSPYASNGQYLGIFQMGSSEREVFGHSHSIWGQARSAYAYYKRAGSWRPWSCRPY